MTVTPDYRYFVREKTLTSKSGKPEAYGLDLITLIGARNQLWFDSLH
jgi:hypothetical protein